MDNLTNYLSQFGYYAISMTLSGSQHFIIWAMLNKNKLKFIVDCGASHSCLSQAIAQQIGLSISKSLDKAVGLGTTQMEKSETLVEQLCLGNCYFNNASFAVLDLASINDLLQASGQDTIDGIIGNDILLKSAAILDFKQHLLYLRQP